MKKQLRSPYKAVKVNGIKMDEHRWVWEQEYGPIPPGYVVHHRDDNKHNNDLSNLQIMTRREHMVLHGQISPHMRDEETYSKWLKNIQITNKQMSKRILDGKNLCAVCELWLPVDNFGKSKHTANGLYYCCKECRKKTRKDRQSKN